jgi:hypothetical protein
MPKGILFEVKKATAQPAATYEVFNQNKSVHSTMKVQRLQPE